MTDSDEGTAGIYEYDQLEMPFLAVESNGGSLDDHAYVCGYEMGVIDAFLSTVPEWVLVCQFSVHEENHEQVDLMAMRYGFNTVIGEPEDGWSTAILSRSAIVEDGGLDVDEFDDDEYDDEEYDDE